VKKHQLYSSFTGKESPVQSDITMLLNGLQNGDKGSAGRIMTLIENRDPGSEEILKRLYAVKASALVIGVTGWPGVGKSSLINRIAKAFLDKDKRVGIIAVDPTSPVSGGGLLGDRIRFREIDGRAGLFIRSVASRGHHGGLSRAARAFVKIMEVMGCDIVIMETVGVGQDQITVSLIADTTIVVTAPGLGDFLQAIKSGILDVADVFVVNKADRRDADKAVQELESSLRMREQTGWHPSVIKTVASDGSGIDTLMEEIERHRVHCGTDEDVLTPKVRAAKHEIREAVKSRLLYHFYRQNGSVDALMERYAKGVCERKVDLGMVADMILAEKGVD
jgi:LAO/AO transport system kinase